MAYANKADARAYQRAHYEANRGYYADAAKRHTKKMRDAVVEWLVAYLAAHPCIDCGEADLVVLEFDHRDPKTKKFCVSSVTHHRRSLKSVQAEVAKCDVRCANCHRRKTYKERGWTSRTPRVSSSVQ